MLKSAEIADKFSPAAVETIGSSPQEFADYIRSEIAKWAGVVKRSGAKID